MIRPTTTIKTLTPLLRHPAQTRNFSIMPRIRQVAKSADQHLHPFQGYPVSQKGAKPDWSVQARHLSRSAAFYFPGFAIILGWPLAMAKVLDGHIV